MSYPITGGSGTSMGMNPRAMAEQKQALGRLSMEAPTVKERYQEELTRAQRRVEQLTEAIAILDRNADTERLLTLVQQIGF